MIFDESYDEIFDGMSGWDIAPRQLHYKAFEEGFKPAAVNEKERSIVSVISTESVDRDRDVVLSSGLDVSSLKSNGVVLYMHDPCTVIGKVLWVKKEPGRVIAKTRFANTDFATEVFNLYKDGFMRGWSIGMDPDTMRRREPRPEEIRRNPEWANARWIVEKAEVIEYSAVSIPANREALNKAFGDGHVNLTKGHIKRWIETRKSDIIHVKTVKPEIRRVHTIQP